MVKRGRGRPTQYGRYMNHLHTRAPDPMRDYIRRVGGGNVSEGLREVVRRAWDSEVQSAVRKYDLEFTTLRDVIEKAEERIAADPFLNKYKDYLMSAGRWDAKDRFYEYEFLAFAPREAILDRLIVEGGGEYPKPGVPA